jgi:His-Xaa-Ser system protein HxsD
MPLMLPMPLTHHMSQVANEERAPKITIDVDFDASIQTLSALEAAAYRLIGAATCQIEKTGDRFVCHLAAQNDQTSGGFAVTDADALKVRFLDLVTDENLRARVSEKTDGVRNVILALAFGSLAASQNDN